MNSIGNKSSIRRHGSLLNRRQSRFAGFMMVLLPWLQLIHLHELLLISFDSICGACVSSFLCGAETSLWGMIDACFCSAALYFFGCIQNAWCDITEDRRLHPGRPLASRRISMFAAIIVAFACICVALLLAVFNGRRAFVVALLIIAVTCAYNFILKKRIYGGPIGMGLCRGLNMLLGASIFGFPDVIALPVVALGVAVACIFWLHGKTSWRQIPGKTVFYPLLSMILGWLFVMPFMGKMLGSTILPSLGLVVIAVCIAFVWALRVFNRTTELAVMKRFLFWQKASIVFWNGAVAMLVLPGEFVVVSLTVVVLVALSLLLDRFILVD